MKLTEFIIFSELYGAEDVRVEDDRHGIENATVLMRFGSVLKAAEFANTKAVREQKLTVTFETPSSFMLFTNPVNVTVDSLLGKWE